MRPWPWDSSWQMRAWYRIISHRGLRARLADGLWSHPPTRLEHR